MRDSKTRMSQRQGVGLSPQARREIDALDPADAAALLSERFAPRALLEALMARAPEFAADCGPACKVGSGRVVGCPGPKVPRWCSSRSVGGPGICTACCAKHGCEGEDTYPTAERLA